VDSENDIAEDKPSSAGSLNATAAQTKPQPVRAALKLICRASRPADLPAAWEFLKPSRLVREFKAPPETVEKWLLQQLTIDELLLARVFVELGGRRQLSPVFSESAKFAFVLNEQGQLTDANSVRGDLKNYVLPVRNYSMSATGPTEQRILTATDDELSVFTALGFRCASPQGLSTLSGPVARQLFPNVPWVGGQQYHLILPAWDIAILEARATQAVLAILKRLTIFERELGLPVSRLLKVWLPTPAELQAIRDRALIEDIKATRKAMDLSIKRSCHSPIDALRALQRPPLDYGAARRGLAKGLRRSKHIPLPGEIAAALKQVRAFYERDVINKFERDEKDPFKKLLNSVGAQLASDWFETQHDIMAAQSVVNGSYPRDFERLDDAYITRRYKLADEIFKLCRTKISK